MDVKILKKTPEDRGQQCVKRPRQSDPRSARAAPPQKPSHDSAWVTRLVATHRVRARKLGHLDGGRNDKIQRLFMIKRPNKVGLGREHPQHDRAHRRDAHSLRHAHGGEGTESFSSKEKSRASPLPL